MVQAWTRYALAMPLMLSVVAVNAQTLPADAYERRITQEDARRLMRMMMDAGVLYSEPLKALIGEKRETSDRMLVEIYGPTPDLGEIERMRDRLKEIQREINSITDKNGERFYHGLSAEDRLKYLKLNAPLPPTLIVPDKQPVTPND